ncbi:MAG: hypothetical protein ACREQ5_09490, partial [Candidatus Dormibacteria bacterium]
MLTLTNTAASLLVTLSANNSNVDYAVTYIDVSATGLSPNSIWGTVNSNVQFTLLNNPNATPRQVLNLALVNTDKANSQSIQVTYASVGQSANVVPSANLAPGYALVFQDTSGWEIVDASGLKLTENTVFVGDATGQGTTNVALTLANTAVVPGSYIWTSLTVDSKGRLTAVANGNVIDSISSTDTANAASANAVRWAFNAANANALAAYA